MISIDKQLEFQRYDGWYNNLANPHWGSVGAHLHRDAPSDYQDGVYMMNTELPSARELSELVFNGSSGIPNRRNVTTMLVFFSQIVTYEILQSSQISCPLEMHKITVPKCDHAFDPNCEGKVEMPFIRAKYDKKTGYGFNTPREQVNERTSWIDASFLYSVEEPWVASLRSWSNGTLAEGFMPGYPPLNNPRIPLINPAPPQINRLMNPERLFMLGDPRANENPGLLSLGLILYRWHNIQARRIQAEHPTWTDEEVFQAARRWVIATLQKIILYDFVPALLADPEAIPAYTGYKPHVPPGVSHAFAAAAFRFPHTLVPPALLLRKQNHGQCEFREDVSGFSSLRLCQNWWNAQDIIREYTVDEVVLGMASQIAEDEDVVIVEDLRDYVFGPMHFTRLDAVALTIMRCRDNGLPSYNILRQSFNLAPRNWSTINPLLYEQQPEMFSSLATLYENDIGKLDAYVGGMLETNGNGPGELFSAIIRDQFTRLRDSDRFWFENTANGFFTKYEIKMIHSITLRDIIRETTSISNDELQSNVFFWKDGDPCSQPFQVNSTGLEACVPFMRMDHFSGNEVTYIYSCIAIGIIPLICIGIGFLLIQKRKKMGGGITPRIGKALINTPHDSFLSEAYRNEKKERIRVTAIEWIKEDYCRSVVCIIDMEPSLRIEKPRGGLLRYINLNQIDCMDVTISETGSTLYHGPFVLISVPKHYDLVIRVQSEHQCSQMVRILHEIMDNRDKQFYLQRRTNSEILEMAETMERRQAKLDRFFREAYAKLFNDPSFSDGQSNWNETVSQEVLDTALTKAELAEALGMLESDLFVERMFACMATCNGDTQVNFAGFLSVLKRFTQGTLRDKLKVLFEMCDRDGNGYVEREEFCNFVKSLNVAAGVKVDEEIQDAVLQAVLNDSGISSENPMLSRADFEAIFHNNESIQRPMGMHMRGAKLKINLEDTISVSSFAAGAEKEVAETWGARWLSYLETYRQHIVILFLFASVNLLLFFERFWHYRYETEHRDLRRVMGVGIAITRGAAASLSFCMGLILTTVCRNIITLCRETQLKDYIPFDSSITFHKIVGIVAGFWALVHTVGHCVNFYHVATQSKEGLQCLFQDALFRTNFLPSISYWFYGTITGVTGILLVATMSIIYVFSAPAVLKQAYHAFRITHLLNILLYGLTILHGLPKLLDSPKFFYYIIGPTILFVFDRIIGMRCQYNKLQIINAKILPSDIIFIQFKRPHSFRFRSGQWVRVSCPAFSCTFNEMHAFSLASAPQDPVLELYIKAVGPWTWSLRNEIICSQSSSTPYPVLHLNGPYGDGNQDWHEYDVAVLIGGGIGITPYASILTDLLLEKSSGKYTAIKCKKVYFIWVCPTHKNYEWFINVLRKVEKLNKNGILETHIFVTQFFHKFDLRTTMLYICENYFRGNTDGRSMFTGLRATNHFGRPKFESFFRYVQRSHPEVEEVGVFSCGPDSINHEIRNACTVANRIRDAPSFIHRYETF
uniref:NAD(P)H oxidase (H2O2-forming) n=1 Tax=Syphacia muris TaxID=451379 RepID=A0A0N5APC8_9BILA